MIESVVISNYLSLKRVNVSLRPLNVLVGPNMSGKSNFIDALRFLQSIATSTLGKTLTERGCFYTTVR
jgi:predicted ATPase